MSPDELSARLRDGTLALADVRVGKSRFGGNEAFFRGRREFAHFHTSDLIDVRLPPAAQKKIRGDPRIVPRRSTSPWLELRFATEADVEFVLAQVRAAHSSAG